MAGHCLEAEVARVGVHYACNGRSDSLYEEATTNISGRNADCCRVTRQDTCLDRRRRSESQVGELLEYPRVFETQYRIMRSRMVAKKVVDALGLDKDLDFLGVTRIEDEACPTLENADAVSILVASLSVARIG